MKEIVDKIIDSFNYSRVEIYERDLLTIIRVFLADYYLLADYYKRCSCRCALYRILVWGVLVFFV